MRFFIMPAAAGTLEPGVYQNLREAINRRWRWMVYGLIGVFILTGLYTFVYVVLPTPLGRYRALYHGIFGMKMVLALGAFFIASALPGRTKGLAFMRAQGKLWLGVLVGLMLAILLLANVLHGLRQAAGG